MMRALRPCTGGSGSGGGVAAVIVIALLVLVSMQVAMNWFMWVSVQESLSLAQQGAAGERGEGGRGEGRGDRGGAGIVDRGPGVAFARLDGSDLTSGGRGRLGRGGRRGSHRGNDDDSDASSWPSWPVAQDLGAADNTFIGQFWNGPPPRQGTITRRGGRGVVATPAPAAVVRGIQAIDFSGDDNTAGGGGGGGGAGGAAATPALFPPAGVTADEFHAAWEGSWALDASTPVRFVVVAEGGVRLWVDGKQLLDEWSDRRTGEPQRHVIGGLRLPVPPAAANGLHHVRLEYFRAASRASRRHLRRFDGGDPLTDWQNVRGETKERVADDSEWFRVAQGLAGARVRLAWEPDPLGLKIFVYDLPGHFNKEIVAGNPKCKTHMFAAELRVHEALEADPYGVTTKDPDAADYFYLPVYSSCKYMPPPYFGVNPWFGEEKIREAVQLVRKDYPHWDRSAGEDHIVAVTYDYGACFEYKYDKAAKKRPMPELVNTIMLTSISDTSLPCFRPSRDIAIPMVIDNAKFDVAGIAAAAAAAAAAGAAGAAGSGGGMLGGIVDKSLSALFGGPRQPVSDVSGIQGRSIFCFFWGSFRWFDNDPDYSKGVRLALQRHHQDDPLFKLGEGKSATYVDDLKRSLFCLCPRGFAVWSPRIYESLATGCIPVIIADEIQVRGGVGERGEGRGGARGERREAG